MTRLPEPRTEPDPMEGAPIRCTVEMAGDGTVTLLRDHGCTEADARDLCALVGRGEAVIDRTPTRNES